jgi:hypothetical protein
MAEIRFLDTDGNEIGKSVLDLSMQQEAVERTIEFCIDGVVILRLDEEGFIYKSQRIEDAGEAHRTFLEVFHSMKEANKRPYVPGAMSKLSEDLDKAIEAIDAIDGEA